MSFDERLTWLLAAIMVAAPGYYLVSLLTIADARPIHESGYQTPMALSLVGSLAVFAIGYYAIRAATADRRSDERDTAIDRQSQIAAGGLIFLGAVAALVMAMLDVEQFWIANAVYASFALSGWRLCASRLIGYRGGLPS
jgi:hypothetical protein